MKFKKFYLKFNDDQHSLTSVNGIDAGQFAELLVALDRVITDKKKTFTVSQIRGNCYMPEFTTYHDDIYEKFKIVHSNIQLKDIAEIDEKEYQYSKKLKQILGNDKYVEAKDEDEGVIVKLYSHDIGVRVDSYYVITTINATISEIGGPHIESETHIRADEVSYRISTTKEQDEALKGFYKKGKLSLKIKQRRASSDDRVINAQLLSFMPKKPSKLIESISDIPEATLSFLKGINSREELLRLIKS